MVQRSLDVDVIILSMNRIEETVAAIASALEQKGVEKHVWVVDQGSSPDQLAQLKEFVSGKPVALRTLGRNLGVPGERNLASRMGNAPVIVALDNDAIFADDSTLRRAAAKLAAEPGLGAVSFRILNYFTGVDDVSSWGYPRALLTRSTEEFPTAQFVGAGHAIRRSAFEAAGEYDERLFFACEEVDLSYRLLNLGLQIRYVPDLVVLHKVSPEARVRWSGGRFYYSMRNRLYLHAKYGASPLRIARSACGYMLKGFYNGVIYQTLKAVPDAYCMYRAFRKEGRNQSLCELKPEVKSYIRTCHLEDQESLLHKLLRQVLRRFPESA